MFAGYFYYDLYCLFCLVNASLQARFMFSITFLLQNSFAFIKTV